MYGDPCIVKPFCGHEVVALVKILMWCIFFTKYHSGTWLGGVYMGLQNPMECQTSDFIDGKIKACTTLVKFSFNFWLWCGYQTINNL